MTEEQLKARRMLSRFGLSLVVLGGIISLFGIYFLYVGNRSLSWPSVEGRLVSSSVKTRENNRATIRRGIKYYVSVKYKYDVDGKTYVSSRYSIGGGDRASDLYPTRSQAEKQASKLFPPESELTVYYDPKNPGSAILAPGLNLGTFAPLLIGIFFAGMGGLFNLILKKATTS